MKLAIPLLALGSLISIPACGPEDQCACTTDFRAVQFLVVASAGGAPIPVDSVATTLVRTGERLQVAQSGLHAGVVTVVDDSDLQKLEARGDSVRVRFTAVARAFVVDMVVGVDQPCRCHVLKLSGPEFVMVR